MHSSCSYFLSHSPSPKYKFEYAWKLCENVVAGEDEELLYIQVKNSKIYSWHIAA